MPAQLTGAPRSTVPVGRPVADTATVAAMGKVNEVSVVLVAVPVHAPASDAVDGHDVPPPSESAVKVAATAAKQAMRADGRRLLIRARPRLGSGRRELSAPWHRAVAEPALVACGTLLCSCFWAFARAIGFAAADRGLYFFPSPPPPHDRRWSVAACTAVCS